MNTPSREGEEKQISSLFKTTKHQIFNQTSEKESKMQKLFISALAVSLLAGCASMTPARYSASVDNHLALKKTEGKPANLVSLDTATNYQPTCRLAGTIQAPDNMTMPQYIQKAINDELKSAGRYAENGIAWRGTLKKIDFSSGTLAGDGYWQLGLELNSENKKSLWVETKYTFTPSFWGMTSCHYTAQAFPAAVQDLITKLIAHPDFHQLMR